MNYVLDVSSFDTSCRSSLFCFLEDSVENRDGIFYICRSHGQFSTACQFFCSALMKHKTPRPRDGQTVPNMEDTAWPGSKDPKERHGRTDISTLPCLRPPSTETPKSTGYTNNFPMNKYTVFNPFLFFDLNKIVKTPQQNSH